MWASMEKTNGVFSIKMKTLGSKLRPQQEKVSKLVLLINAAAAYLKSAGLNSAD